VPQVIPVADLDRREGVGDLDHIHMFDDATAFADLGRVCDVPQTQQPDLHRGPLVALLGVLIETLVSAPGSKQRQGRYSGVLAVTISGLVCGIISTSWSSSSGCRNG